MSICVDCGTNSVANQHTNRFGVPLCVICYGKRKLKLHAQNYGGNVAYKRSYQHPPLVGTSSYNQTKSQPQCSFEWDVARCAYAVRSQYQENFIEFIKAKIPGSDRAWDPGSKTWYIKDAWYDIMFELASQLWPGAVTSVTRSDAERAWKEQEAARAAMLKAQREAVLSPFESALLTFCELCDSDSLKQAYRRAAQALHPDKQGGDGDKMARLNAAWFVVEQELKKRSESK